MDPELPVFFYLCFVMDHPVLEEMYLRRRIAAREHCMRGFASFTLFSCALLLAPTMNYREVWSAAGKGSGVCIIQFLYWFAWPLPQSLF
jgi:hypothetical protein